MIENGIEKFHLNNCPECGGAHVVKIDVYRDILPNDINKGIRVPLMKQVDVHVICPKTEKSFQTNIMYQEDVYSKVVKLCRCYE